MSTFGTYSIASSGMYVSQAGLMATSNNLTNINTTGASRVRVESSDLATTQNDGTTTLSGASVSSITRARNELLDTTYRSENADANYWSVKDGNLEYMNQLLSEYESDSTTDSDESSDTGIQQALTDFFTAWNTLATTPTSSTDRKALLTAASDLLDKTSDLYSSLQQLQADAVTGVTDGVTSLNDLASQVADLNGQISEAEVGGDEASYLRDQRDELLDEMSSLADITANESDDGTLAVSVGGVWLVHGDDSYELTVEGTGTTDDPLTVSSEDFGCTVDITSGSIAAYMEDADQTGYETVGDDYDYSADATSSITNLCQALNDLVTTIATAVNSYHSQGYGIDSSSTTGLDFFTTVDSSQPLSITNIQVNPTLVSNENLIAASQKSGETGDNTIAEEIYDLQDDDDLYSFDGVEQSISSFYESVISWAGTEGDTASSTYKTQSQLVSQVDNERQTVSSISTDEELSNMIKYQEAYSASARVLSTIDSLIGDMIEQIG